MHLDGPALPGLFATEPSQIVPRPPSPTGTMSVSSTAQHQSTHVDSSPPKKRWSYAASNASSELCDMANVDLATYSSRPTLLGSHLGRRSQSSTYLFFLLVQISARAL